MRTFERTGDRRRFLPWPVLCYCFCSFAWGIGLAPAQAPEYPVAPGRTMNRAGATIGFTPLGPFGPYSLFGYVPSFLSARQPVGHRITATGPNGYVYGPVYEEDLSREQEEARLAYELGDEDLLIDDSPDGADARGAVRPEDNLESAALENGGLENGATALDPRERFGAAVDAFHDGRYVDAVRWLAPFARGVPRDGMAELLRAQALFALGKYEHAYRALNRAARILPADERGRLVEHSEDYYGPKQSLARQLRSLEGSVERNPEDHATRGLLGYMYGFLGYADLAVEELAVALDLAPKDSFAKELLAYFQEVQRQGDLLRAQESTADDELERDDSNIEADASEPDEEPRPGALREF